jgi:hypothetical protein
LNDDVISVVWLYGLSVSSMAKRPASLLSFKRKRKEQ